jgi:hypothetical protein
VYADSEFPLRYANFMANLRMIEAQNSVNDGLTYGLNQYSGMCTLPTFYLPNYLDGRRTQITSFVHEDRYL